VFDAVFGDYVITSGFILFAARKRYTEFRIGSLSFRKSLLRKKIEESLEELQSVLKDEKTDSTHKEDHDSLKRPIRGLESLVETRTLRRRVSRMHTGKELGADPEHCTECLM
jgi:hypothetical protein